MPSTAFPAARATTSHAEEVCTPSGPKATAAVIDDCSAPTMPNAIP